jgi:hypothetical protein
VVETGLLEQGVLVLRLNSQGEWRLFAEFGQPVGLARSTSERSVWWWPFPQPVLAIHELEDEPLVCTVRPCWGLGAWFRVLDGNDHPVGFLLAGRIWGALGQRLANRQGDRFLAPDGRILAEMSRRAGEEQLRFREEVGADPFAKMLLLAAVLVQSRL